MPLPNWGSTPIPVVLVDETGAPISGANPLDTGAGGGGGGAATIADGADVAEGAVADAAYTTGSGTVVSILKGIFTKLGLFIFGTATPASNASGLVVRQAAATTGTQSIVASSATDVTILAANTSRVGATVYNDSTVVLYLLLANTTSSATVYTVQMVAGAYYEVPFRYTGVLKGLWASATGNARVTELT